MSTAWPSVRLGEVIKQRREFIYINDTQMYKRCRVQLHAQGISLRDTVPGMDIKTKSQQVCQADEFLVAEIDAKVGGFGIVPSELEGAIVSSHYFLFCIDETALDRRFLDYYIRTADFQDQVAAQGSTNYAAIRPGDVLGYTIPLPPLDEQRRIVARIDALAARIAEARGLRAQTAEEIELLWLSGLNESFHPLNCSPKSELSALDTLLDQAKYYKADEESSYNNANPGKPSINPDGLYQLPPNWIWTDLGSVLTHLVDCVNDTPDFASTKTDLYGLKSTNIRPYKLDLTQHWFVTKDDFERWNRREKPIPGDIILTREAPMGNACILPEGIDSCLTQRLILLRSDSRFISNRYILHYINSSHFQEQVISSCRGLTTPHIRIKDAPSFMLPLPPLAEQQDIVTYLDDLQAKVDTLKAMQEATAAELDALLPSALDQAFRGEL